MSIIDIKKFLGFLPSPETDHDEFDMSVITGIALIEGRLDRGPSEIMHYGLRPEDVSSNAQNIRVQAQLWRNSGGVIPDWKPPTIEEFRKEMHTLSARQLRLGLIQYGCTLAQIDSVIESLEDDILRDKAKIEWEYATELERLHPLILNLFAALGFSPEQVDDLWRESMQI
ncbi:F-BAR domain-containing protein [uncultured Roseibium sp.]|uniref:F-BAR domain-containing protein n=1 Tax=uncultured Roseibium sp. TaxID=1936171 RepID=UPI0026299E57|nr:F-BAR domain-containing protein [uncultured Roseibium sp.]